MRLGIALFFAMALRADTLGYVQQKFTDLHFEKGKWARSSQLPCFAYEATEDEAPIEILRQQPKPGTAA
jgi:hypothetical protein